MNKTNYPVDVLLDLLDGNQDALQKVHDEIIDTGRWTINHAMVFCDEGKYFRVRYQLGATEEQEDIEPFERYERGGFVECTEVRPVEKLIIVYEVA